MVKRLLIIAPFLLYFLIVDYNLYAQPIPAKAKKHFNQGLSAFERQDYEKALKEFEEAKRWAENWPEVYYQLALTYKQLGMYDTAIKSLSNYLRLCKLEDYSEAQKFMDILMDKSAEASKFRWIFQEHIRYPDSWSIEKKTGVAEAGDFCGPGRGLAYQEVSDDEYEMKVFQGEDYNLNPIYRWIPIKFKDNFFEYTTIYYQCGTLTPEEARKYLGMKPGCPWVVKVKGEIILGEPVKIKFNVECEPPKIGSKVGFGTLVIKKSGR